MFVSVRILIVGVANINFIIQVKTYKAFVYENCLIVIGWPLSAPKPEIWSRDMFTVNAKTVAILSSQMIITTKSKHKKIG